MDVEILSDEICLIHWRGRVVAVPVGSVTLRVCAWCDALIAECDRGCGPCTHGQCRDCYLATMADLEGVRIATGGSDV